METDIPENLSDLRIGADAWCGVQEPVAHALTHDDIQDAVAEYLAAGGVITTIPAGVSSNQTVLHFEHGFSPFMSVDFPCPEALHLSNSARVEK